MLPSLSKDKIQNLIRQSMFRLLKEKTGIVSPVYIHRLEYAILFKKEEGVVKVSSVYIKNINTDILNKVSSIEIKFSGATSNEFIEYLDIKGAKKIDINECLLEKI